MAVKDWYDRAINFANQHLSIILWFCIFSGILIFLPDKYLGTLYIEPIISYIRPPIGLIFIFSGSLLFVKFFFFIGSVVNTCKTKRSNRRSLIKLEHLLRIAEEDQLSKKQDYIDWGTKVAPLLKFNDDYYLPFMENLDVLPHPYSNLQISPAIQSMVGLLRMAVNDLEENV